MARACGGRAVGEQPGLPAAPAAAAEPFGSLDGQGERRAGCPGRVGRFVSPASPRLTLTEGMTRASDDTAEVFMCGCTLGAFSVHVLRYRATHTCST